MNRYYKREEVVSGYSIIKILGQGRYGIAYLAKNDRDEKVIVKQLKEEMLKATKEKLIYEEKILRSLNSSKFPKFISKFKDEYGEGYILEYMEGRVFEDIIAVDGYEFSKKEIYKIGSKLLEFVEILQKNNIVHRDIRLPNVIINKKNELFLIDFGLARIIDDEIYLKEVDYWYIGDFLLHLYYSSYKETKEEEEKPWYEELDLTSEEITFLKRLMSIDEPFKSIEEIREQIRRLEDTD